MLVPAALLAAAPAAAHLAPAGDDGERASAAARVAQSEEPLPPAKPPEPPLVATPRATCGPGSRPEPDIQGRVPAEAIESGAAKDGYVCNIARLGQEGANGGFKVRRFVDKAGHECAYYDTTLMFPTNASSLSQQPAAGVAVLDMSDPAKPVRTDTLVTPAMQTPHESVVLNQRRGLLAAVTGNLAFYPGIVDIYDLNEDCRHPVLQSSLPVGVLGHESGFAEDGLTFYATSLATGGVTAVDVTDPKLPVILWRGDYRSHGLTLSDDGNRAYIAANTGLLIIDVSEVQARKPNPQVREVSRLTWDSLTIPQVAIPVTIGGRPYIVEVDEYSKDDSPTVAAAHGPTVGAARIIDLADEKAPRVVSNIRLEVHQPENREVIANDPGAQFPAQGYAGHYCDVPQRTEPGIFACSFIVSGLRVFDIRDPEKPREIAYHVAPPEPNAGGMDASNWAMSQPTFVPERGEIWYSDGNSGFYSLRVAEGVWPFAAPPGEMTRCTPADGLTSVFASPAGRSGVVLGFSRRRSLPVRVDVFAVSRGRRIVRERLVARFDGLSGSRTWDCVANRGGARRVGDGYYLVRYTMLDGGRAVDVRRLVLRRSGERFARRADSHRRDTCALLSRFKLERPVFGGPGRAALRAAYRLASDARVTVTVTRGGRTVRRFAAADRRAGRTYRLSLPARGLPAGDYRVRLTAVGGGETVTATLTARRL